MMNIKLIYSFILLGTSSALAPGRNSLRHLAVQNGIDISPASLPLAAAEVAAELSEVVPAEDIAMAQQHVDEAVSNMEGQLAAVAEGLPPAAAEVAAELSEVVPAEDIAMAQQHVDEAVSNMEGQLAAVAEGLPSAAAAAEVAAELSGVSTEDMLSGGPSLDPACFDPKSKERFMMKECVEQRKLAVLKAITVMIKIQKAKDAIKITIAETLIAIAKNEVDVEEVVEELVIPLISSLKTQIELVKGLLTKLAQAGIEAPASLLKGVVAMEEVMDETHVTMIEVKEVDDTSIMAALLASLLESFAALLKKLPTPSLESLEALMEKLPGAEGLQYPLQEFALTKVASFQGFLSDFKTFNLQVKNVITTCVFKHDHDEHGGSSTSHKSAKSAKRAIEATSYSHESSYSSKSKKESWKEQCHEALKGYKFYGTRLGLRDNSEMMAGAFGLDLTAMESVAPQDQDTTEAASTELVSKFQAYNSSGMHKSFPAAISSILVASAFVLLL